MNITMEILGNRLIKRRHELGMTRIAMSKKCGYSSVSGVFGYERGRYTLSAQTIAKLMYLLQFYELNAEEFFFGVDIDERLMDKARKNYDSYINRMFLLRDERRENETKAIREKLKKQPKMESKGDFAICILKGNDLFWFVKTKEISQSFTYDKLRVNVFERDIDKATKFETIADAREFININGMRIVRWRDYEAEKIKKFD